MLTLPLLKSKKLISLTAFIASIVSSHAAPVAMESFDYAPGTQLNGVGATGAGWTSPWTVIAGGGLRLDADEQSLNFSNSSPFVRDGSGSIKSAGGQASKRSFVPVNLKYETLYFAVLLRSISGAGNHARFIFTDEAGTVRLNVGLADDPADADDQVNLFIHTTEGGYNGVDYGPNLSSTSQNYMLVAKRDGNGVSASLLLGDGSLPQEPLSWDLSREGKSSLTMEHVTLAVSTPTLRLDELRIATSWQGLVEEPSVDIPEPSAFALLLGLLGFGAVLQRRRRG